MIEVDDRKHQWTEEMTIESLLKEIDNTRFCSVVRLNGKLISSPDFHKIKIPDNSIIRLLPLVAGG